MDRVAYSSGGEPIEAGVRSVHIVVDPPFLDAVVGVPVAAEEPLIEALIAQSANEAFDEAVLHRFARRDVVPLDLAILLPAQNGVRGQLGAVVGDDHAGITAALGDSIELPADPLAGDRVVDDRC